METAVEFRSVTWDEVYKRLAKAPPGRLYGIPRGGAIVAGLTGRAVDRVEDADWIVDDVTDERRLAGLRPDLARASIAYEALLTLLGDGRRQTLRSLAEYHARELGLAMHVRREVLESRDAGVFASRVLEAAQALDALDALERKS